MPNRRGDATHLALAAPITRERFSVIERLFDRRGVVEETVTRVVQVDGKARERLPRGVSEEAAGEQALQSAKVRTSLDGKSVGKSVWVPDKLIYLVTA